MDVSEVRADLLDEQAALDAVVAGLTAGQFALPTPSPRWTVAAQLAHLTYFDGNAALAIDDPPAFTASVHDLLEAAAGGDEAIDAFELDAWRFLPPADLLAAWRANRERLAASSAALADDARIDWYGPSMGAKSFLTARLMETWAHGQDIVDAVDGHRPATDRLRHIAQLGYATRKWSYLNRGMEVPEGDVALVLTAPSGATWTWGDDDENTVTGPAEDFCLVVTQRRHVDDTHLQITGDRARDWLIRAQAFAGPATDGPNPKDS
ncbi:TIGR03084 family metal-binding protein [Aquihabitans sp. McL0605]|uniref:TIGR03084 family metal-binding protein n=1 Tax=Aquihabitans sp. McL0605 TaxID=3415671 RepID=UPI003CEFD868